MLLIENIDGHQGHIKTLMAPGSAVGRIQGHMKIQMELGSALKAYNKS